MEAIQRESLFVFKDIEDQGHEMDEIGSFVATNVHQHGLEFLNSHFCEWLCQETDKFRGTKIWALGEWRWQKNTESKSFQ
jgi:hypothetical protein